MTRSEAMAMIRPSERGLFASACRFFGCAEEPGEEPDEEIELGEGYGGYGIYVSCGEYPDEGSSHFGLDPAARCMRGNARRRALLRLVRERTRSEPWWVCGECETRNALRFNGCSECGAHCDDRCWLEYPPGVLDRWWETEAA